MKVRDEPREASEEVVGFCSEDRRQRTRKRRTVLGRLEKWVQVEDLKFFETKVFWKFWNSVDKVGLKFTEIGLLHLTVLGFLEYFYT